MAIRIRRGEKRSSLAGRCGISYKHLYGIERDYQVNRPSIEVLHRIATALDVEVAEVMEDAPKEEDKPKRESNPTTHPEPTTPAPPPTPRRKNGARATDPERGVA